MKTNRMKVLQGSYRKDRDKGIKVKPSETIPDPPEDFTKEQKDLWHDVCKFLKVNKLLQPVGFHMITMYCQQYGLYKLAEEDVDKSGAIIKCKMKYGDIEKKSPALDIMNGTFKNMMVISDHFGLTPLSQGKIKDIGGSKWENAEDELSNWDRKDKFDF